MVSPFMFYVKDGKIVRETVSGGRSGEKSVFGNIQEVCGYLANTDKDLWAVRAIATTEEKRINEIKELAKQIQGA